MVKYIVIGLMFLMHDSYANKITPSISVSKVIVIKKPEPKDPKKEPKVIEPKRNYNGRYNNKV
jgi:hypothetical protein